MQFLILLTMLTPLTLTQTVQYVKPDDSISLNCPGQPCLTLDQYTHQAATYFTTGSTFLFLPGNHTLWTTINLADISDVAFRGMEEQSSNITTIHGNSITITGVINLTIDGLTLKTTNLQIVSSEGILFSNSVFLDNIVSALDCRNSTNITVQNCHFKGNKGKYGGAIHAELLNTLEIIDSTFIKNEAHYDGGAIYAKKCCIIPVSPPKGTSDNVSKTVVTFSRNFAREDGGAMYLHETDVLFSGTGVLFEDNDSGQNGGAISSTQSSLNFKSSTTLFSGNTANNGNGGAIWSAMPRRYHYTSCISGYINSYGFRFNDNITFSYNSAKRGGAMYLEEAVSLQFTPGMNLYTSYNNASEYGGAIYCTELATRDQCRDHVINYNLPRCFIALIGIGTYYPTDLINDTSIAIYSYYNSAGIEGSFLYGGLLDKCHLSLIVVHGKTEIHSITDSSLKSKIHIMQPNNTINAISSQPYKLIFRNNSEIRVHKGEKFNVSVYAVAQDGSNAPTVVTAIQSNTARLKSNQISQNLSQDDSILVYNLYSTEDKEQLTLLPAGPCSDEGKIVVTVILEDCPIGFSQSNDKCICEQRLMKYTTNCTIDEDISIIRSSGSTFWMNASYYENGTYHGLIFSEACPAGYCKTETIAISLDNPDTQCTLNGSGVLCGACATNHSLMLGSSRCHVCPNTYLALLLPFAAAGIVLVVFLSTLRLTVATGMINSVILYANIVQVNRHLFFPNKVNVLTVFIAWMNLDLGFETCFYNGMTTYQQTWLQFAFPIYIWMLITLIIITSRYSVRVSKLIGHNPIAVLATLLLMSYTKILKIIIDVNSSAKLEYPDNKTVTAWLKDGNIPYLQSWHLLLTVVTSVVFIFLFLPYTLLLLLGYKLYCFSGKKHMRWLNRLKPLLDSYYAPYNKHTRFWTGFLLLVRCALYIEFSLGKEMSLLAIIITFVLIVLGLTLISGRIYSNIITNIIESSTYSNLIILSVITLAMGPVANSQLAVALVYSLVGMVFAIMVGVIVYHFHTLYTAHTLVLRIQIKISNFFHGVKTPKKNEELSPESATKVVSTTVIELREPLLDN